LQPVGGCQRDEIGQHGTVDGNPAQGGLDLHHAGFLRRTNPDKKGDEDEKWVAEQANKAQPKGNQLTQCGSRLGGAGVFHAGCQQGAHHPSPVHRECRDEVEECQRQVDHRQADEEAAALQVQVRQGGDSAGQEQHRQQEDGNHHVDERTRQRHLQFLAGFLGHPLQARHAANWQQGDVAGLNAILAGSQGVPQLVQQHTAKQCQDEADIAAHRSQAPVRHPGGNANPAEQEKKRGVNGDFNPRHLCDFPGPFHGDLQKFPPSFIYMVSLTSVPEMGHGVNARCINFI